MTETNVYLFSGVIVLIHIMYLTTFFGIIAINKNYIHNFSTIVQLGVCLFLTYRFFPYKTKYVITPLDVSLIFYCATFLLLNVVSIEIYSIFLKGNKI